MRSSFVIVCLSLQLFAYSAFALEKPGEELTSVHPATQLGASINMELPFIAEDGSHGTLASFARPNRPFIIVPAYYHCEHLCGLVLKGVQDMLMGLDLKLNDDFRVITVSFDSMDSVETASAKSKELLKALPEGRPGEAGWRFLIGSGDSSKELMNQIGFRFVPDKGEFAHSAAIMILTPDGQISQYFTGIQFSPGDVKLALVEAGRGSIGTVIDHVLLFCFRFDQTKGRYTWAAYSIMRAGGVITLILLSWLLIRLRRKDLAKRSV